MPCCSCKTYAELVEDHGGPADERDPDCPVHSETLCTCTRDVLGFVTMALVTCPRHGEAVRCAIGELRADVGRQLGRAVQVSREWSYPYEDTLDESERRDQ